MDGPLFSLTETQRQFRDILRHFCEERIAPNAAEADRAATFPWKSFEACREMELPALGIPEAYGGTGADHVTQALAVEELARVCASTSVTLLISKLGMIPLMNWGSEELKHKYLPRVASGVAQASYCLSEADAGSDVACDEMPRRARRGRLGAHGFQVLDHQRRHLRDVHGVRQVPIPQAGHRGISCFVVEAEWGVTDRQARGQDGPAGEPHRRGGLSTRSGSPPSNLVGEEGQRLPHRHAHP